MQKDMVMRYPGKCCDCGKRIPKGTFATWVRRGVVKHIDCTDPDSIGHTTPPRRFDNEGHTRSHYDPTGFYAADGTLMGRTNARGRCEDAPCCGCCS